MESTSRAKNDIQGSTGTYCFTTFSRPFSSGKQKLREYLGLPACKEGEPRKLYIKKLSKEGKVFPVPESSTQTENRENIVDSQFSLSTLTAIDDVMKQAEKQLEDEKRKKHHQDQKGEKYFAGQSRVSQLEGQESVMEVENERQFVNPPGNDDKSNDIPSMENIEKVNGPSKKKRQRKRKKKVKEVKMVEKGSCQIVEYIEACTQVHRHKSFAVQPGTSKCNSSPKKKTREFVTSDDKLIERQESEWIPLADVILGSGCSRPEPADEDDDCVLLEIIQSPPDNSKKRKGSPEECEQQIPVKKIKPTCNASEGSSQQDQEKSHETVNCIHETNSHQHLKTRIIDDSHTHEQNNQQDQGERIEAVSHTSVYETEIQQVQGKKSEVAYLTPEASNHLNKGKKIVYANCMPKSNSQHSGSIGSVASPSGDSWSRVQLPCKQDISSCTETELTSLIDQPRRSRKRQRKKTSITKLSLSKSQGSCVASTSRNNWRWGSYQRMKTSKQFVDVLSGEESSNTDIECFKTSVGKTHATFVSTVNICKSSLPHSLDKERCFVNANETCKEPDTTLAYTVNENLEVLDTKILPRKEINSDQLTCDKIMALKAPRKNCNLKRIGRIQNTGGVSDTSGSSCDPNSSSSVMEISSSSSCLTGSESITSVSVIEPTPVPVARKKGVISDPAESIFRTQPQEILDCALKKNECRETPVLMKKNEGKEGQDRDGKPQDRQLTASVQEGGNEGGDKCLMLYDVREEESAVYHISSNSTQASDLSTLSSSSTEVLKPEGETCLRAVLQVFQEHFGGSKEDNLRLLQKNNFNLLTSLVEMQTLHPHSKKMPPTIDPDETGENSGG